MPFKDRAKARQFSKEWHQKIRLQALQLLGGSCVHCGANDPIVLDIDHVHNDGQKERQLMTVYQQASRLVQGRLPLERYQLLCKNCNWRKEYFRRNAEGRNHVG